MCSKLLLPCPQVGNNAWEWSYGKHEEQKFTDLNIVWVGTILDGMFWIAIIRVGIFQVGVILGGSFQGGSYPGWKFSRWELTWVGIFFGGGFSGGNCPGGIIQAGIFRVGVFLVLINIYFFFLLKIFEQLLDLTK